MMDGTLTILSLEPMRTVTKLSRKSLSASEKSGQREREDMVTPADVQQTRTQLNKPQPMH